MLLVACVLSVGCDDPYLDGSLPDLLDLQTLETRARLYPSELELAWMDANAPGAVALRVTAPADQLESDVDLPLDPDGTLSLGDHLDIAIPDLADGFVRLPRWPVDEGESVRARFRATLEEVDGLELTAFGHTDAPLEIVDGL